MKTYRTTTEQRLELEIETIKQDLSNYLGMLEEISKANMSNAQWIEKIKKFVGMIVVQEKKKRVRKYIPKKSEGE